MTDYEDIKNDRGGVFFLNIEKNSFQRKDIINEEFVVVKRDFWWPLKSLLNRIGFKFSYKYTIKPKNE